MKAFKSARLVLALSLGLLSSSAFAQMSWTNNLCTNLNSGWWTNTTMFTNMLPMQFTNSFPITIPSWLTNMTSTFTNCNLSGDTKVLLQQFQANREVIIQQFNSMSQQQRQQLLQQLQALREQIQAQIATFRDQAKDQAASMKQRFSDDRNRLLNQAVGGAGGSRGRSGD